MMEEITYANLKFENSHELNNIAEPEEPKEKGPPSSPRSCWPVNLILLMLCLVLLTALVTLAVLFFQIHKDCRTRLQGLNKTKNELHVNFSNTLQAIGNQLCLEGEKSLKNNGQNCVLCPANWKWEGGDTCFFLSKEKSSWEQSHQFCSLQNSTLLLIKDDPKLELVKRFPEETYWVGLTFRAEQENWYWADNTALTKKQRSWAYLHNSDNYCPYFYYHAIRDTSCREKYKFICEKSALQLKQHNQQWKENGFARPKWL